jgi:hypothetical protein
VRVRGRSAREQSGGGALLRGLVLGLVGTLGTLGPLAAGPVHAFTCTLAGGDGPNLAWDTRTVAVDRSGVGAELRDAVLIEEVMAASMDPWNRVGCSDIQLVVGPPTTDRLTGFDWAAGSGSPANHNILVFRNGDVSDPVDAWLHQLGALAITTVTFESHQGRLLDADIEMNDATFRFTACDGGQGCVVEFDLQNTLTHELGHVLGLDHSLIAEATMFASAPRADTSKRTLADDDEEAVCVVYPAGAAPGLCPGAPPRSPPPDVRFETTLCGAGPSSAPLGAFGCLLLFGRRWSRRRRRRG